MLFYDMGAYTMSAASTFNGMPKPKCYHVLHEAQWIALCRQSGMAIDIAPSMKAGLDLSAVTANSDSDDKNVNNTQQVEIEV